MNSSFSTKIISIDELWRFFNLSSSLFCIAGKDGCFKHINPAFTHLLGFDEEELVSSSYENFIHPDDRMVTNKNINELKNGKTVAHFQNRYLMYNGNYKWFTWTAFLPNANGDIYAIGQDCTEKVILQEQLIQQRVQEERTVMRAMIHGQEMEKIEIGKELHDNINQMLTTVKLYHEMILSNGNLDKNLLQKGSQILLAAIEEIRKLSKSLVAPGVDELSLADSVQDLVNTIKQGKEIIINFSVSQRKEELPVKIKLTLFRIIQEQLNNILKHANAKTVNIQISDDAANIKLTIQDDGQGFDTSKKKNGIGLKNIISRAELYNGTVKIDSAPGKGCLLEVNIPSEEIFKIDIN
jgi:PAS domain S-box-containing protein